MSAEETWQSRWQRPDSHLRWCESIKGGSTVDMVWRLIPPIANEGDKLYPWRANKRGFKLMSSTCLFCSIKAQDTSRNTASTLLARRCDLFHLCIDSIHITQFYVYFAVEISQREFFPSTVVENNGLSQDQSIRIWRKGGTNICESFAFLQQFT